MRALAASLFVCHFHLDEIVQNYSIEIIPTTWVEMGQIRVIVLCLEYQQHFYFYKGT